MPLCARDFLEDEVVTLYIVIEQEQAFRVPIV